MHVQKSTKLETIICKQKTSKTKNAQSKPIKDTTKIKTTEFDLCCYLLLVLWSTCLPLSVADIVSDIPLKKTILSFASNNNWR